MGDILSNIGAIASIVGVILPLILFVRYWLVSKPTWKQSLKVARKLMDDIDRSDWKPDAILGIGRSGGIWGGWLAGNLGSKPFSVIDVEYVEDSSGRSTTFPKGIHVIEYFQKRLGSNVKLLLVQGASANGQTITKFKKEFAPKLEGWDIRTAVLYQSSASPKNIDFVGHKGIEPWPERFPWHLSIRYRPHLRRK